MHVLSVVFSYNMMIFHNLWFCPGKTDVLEGTGHVVIMCKMSEKWKNASGNSFWSSRARVVYIFEEELNGFSTINFICYFVVKILRFRHRYFYHRKTKVCGARRVPKRAPR